MYRKWVFMLVLSVMGILPTVAMAQESLVDGAVAELSDRVNVPSEQIIVQSVIEVIWPDSLLGCYIPDYTGAQVLTSGWRIILVVDGSEHYYHASEDAPAFWCSSEYTSLGYPQSVVPSTVPLSISLHDISALQQTTNVQMIVLTMIVGTICMIYRVNYSDE